jgi:hypothetical protein
MCGSDIGNKSSLRFVRELLGRPGQRWRNVKKKAKAIPVTGHEGP